MPIISKPRRIIVDLDPEQGFPVSVCVESRRYIEDSGANLVDIQSHIEPIPPDSPMAVSVLGEATSAATTALTAYQSEVQRLASEYEAAVAKIQELESRLGE